MISSPAESTGTMMTAAPPKSTSVISTITLTRATASTASPAITQRLPKLTMRCLS